MHARVKQELIDEIAKQEVQALLEGLNDEEMRRNPAFLAKVRQFLKENNFITTTETDGVADIRGLMNSKETTIPDLVSEYDAEVQ